MGLQFGKALSSTSESSSESSDDYYQHGYNRNEIYKTETMSGSDLPSDEEDDEEEGEVIAY
jgi:hypothetical protein